VGEGRLHAVKHRAVVAEEDEFVVGGEQRADEGDGGGQLGEGRVLVGGE